MFDELRAVNFKVKTFEESSSRSRCVFGTQASTHVGAFLWINLKAYYFHNKNSIIDVQLG